MMVGTAFDYLLHLNFSAAPHAVARRWVAESAAIWWRIGDKGNVGALALWRDDKGAIITQPPLEGSNETVTKEVAYHVRDVLEKAKSAHSMYLKNKSPMRRERTDLAAMPSAWLGWTKLCAPIGSIQY